MDKYGLIGYPLTHSFSKRFFTEKFARESINATYENYEIPQAGTLLEIVASCPELKGLNCTIPHKQAIIPLMDELSPRAQKIGAVNVIRIQHDVTGKAILKGYNSDIIGFKDSIKPLLTTNHHKALIIGTGGAAKAIALGLTEMGLSWTFVSRSRRPGMLGYEDLTPEVIKAHEVIINCSPVGMFPHTNEAPDLPYEALGRQHLLYDLIYNPSETEFMKRGAQYGAATKNGYEMLCLQAEASWKIWNELE